MNAPRKISLSLAAFVLVCFFLPWLELSCMGMRDSLSGYDLARSVDRLLWIIPILMLSIVSLAASRFVFEKMPALMALAMTAGGAISAYLMYCERASTGDSPQLIASQWTIFFWLGFLACVALVIAGFAFYAKRGRSP